MEEQRPVTSLEAAISSIKAEVEGVRELIKEIDKRYSQRFEQQEKIFNNALYNAEKAVTVAEVNSEKWRANANEWRNAMNDRELRFVLKDQLSPTITGLQKEVDEIKTTVTLSTGRGMGYDKMWAIILGVLGSGGVLGFLVAHYTK